MEDIIYFELNNWEEGVDYPDNDRFEDWFSDDLNIVFDNDEWVKENKLCVVETYIDMSVNFCVTATKKWVDDNCPELLTEYSKFLRVPDDEGVVCGRFGTKFLNYCDENIGITYVEEDDY